MLESYYRELDKQGPSLKVHTHTNLRPTGFHACLVDWAPWKRLVENGQFSEQCKFFPFFSFLFMLLQIILTQGFLRADMQSVFWAVVVTTGKFIREQPFRQCSPALLLSWESSFYAVIIGSLSSTIHNMDATGELRRRKMEALNQYLRFQRVPKLLQRRIRDYYEYLWTSHQKTGLAPGSTIVSMRLKVAHPILASVVAQNHERICRRAPGVRALPHRTAKVVHYDSRGVHFHMQET